MEKVKEKIITTTKGLVVKPMNWVDLELKKETYVWFYVTENLRKMTI